MTDRADEAPPRAGMEHHIGHVLRRAYALARKNSAEALNDLGDLSPVQASALVTLTRGALTQAELGRRIGMEPANTHTLIKRMIAAGLVETRPDPANRRLMLVDHSVAGRAITTQIEARLAVSADRTLAPLSAKERVALIAMLQRVVGA